MHHQSFISQQVTGQYDGAMRRALDQARAAIEHDDVPVGAVILGPDGAELAAEHNRKEERGDPTAHAEMIALQVAAARLGTWHLDGCTLVVSLEPCAMCAMAAVWSRIGRIVYGASDPKAGAAWSLYNIPQDPRLNHTCQLEAGVLAAEAAALLEEFFAQRR